MVEKENVDTQAIAIVGIFGAILTFVLILGIQVLYYRAARADAFKKVVQPGNEELKAMVIEQQGSLIGYRWVDRGKQTVTIPIDRAMDIVVQDLRAKKH